MTYANPEPPALRTPSRSPTPRPRRWRCSDTRRAADSVSRIGMYSLVSRGGHGAQAIAQGGLHQQQVSQLLRRRFQPLAEVQRIEIGGALQRLSNEVLRNP